MHVHTTPPDGGEHIAAGPSTTLVRVPGSATDDRLSVVEMRLAAGWSGPPPHVHEVVGHCWFVLDGEVELSVDGAAATHGTGECLWVPPGTVHGFSTADTDGATVLQVDVFAALDGYFRDLQATLGAGTAPDPAAVAEVMARHDTRAVLTS